MLVKILLFLFFTCSIFAQNIKVSQIKGLPDSLNKRPDTTWVKNIISDSITSGDVYTKAETRVVIYDTLLWRGNFVTPEMFGAIGDGTTDDTQAMQDALNSGLDVIGKNGSTYLIDSAGQKTLFTVAYNYCVTIPSNTKLIGNGAKLKLKDGANAALIMNVNAGTSTDSLIEISGWEIDGNSANQTTPATGEMACIFLQDVVKANVQDIIVRDARDYAGRFLKIHESYFNNLSAYHAYGSGWSFGIGANDQRIQDSFIDNIYAEDCQGLQGLSIGNPFILTGKNVAIGSVHSKNSAGGFKIQDNSENITVSEIINTGGAYNSNNSGVKIQGGVSVNFPS